MARNRKRAKERRARRPQPVATARADGDDATPGAIAHAAPDVELAEAQLALGRPELVDAAPGGAEAAEAEAEADAEAAQPGVDGEFGEGPEIPGVLPGRASIERGEVEQVHAPVAETRPRSGYRLINFLQGSWRELQRVQWPDRRQVMQATAVVIGFVIVAGAFLGVADLLAGKIVNLILK